ncbi:MAG: carbamoyl phosphate synthase large subunit [Candidatus Lindowbacteria bacterium RIFCSPLOWO2_12_FULL_62_27]|nr:MAG: carbamoyl phosphate synthase large subunit [Candidatus Lindowbacteria bacterium RIFCSPLOWO2_12_FULL_62_27]
MPRRPDIHTVLLIGSGPIVIGQACEFDYSGSQACRALREEGLKVVLLNNNPATIMTDVETADRTYIEPMNPAVVEHIVSRERVDAILPTMGGQTALNLVTQLADAGFFRRRRVRVIGASVEAIRKAEDRQRFKQAMIRIGLEVPASGVASSVRDVQSIARRLGFPVILRPSFTLGGTGAGIAHNPRELVDLASRALGLSPVHQVLVEESVLGWKEFELEVIRDCADNFIVVCSIENIDPMGVHTGDSVCVAPAQTLPDAVFQRMRDAAKKIVREIGVDTGGCNIQFALHPRTYRCLVIEMNPRVSRSSALASKATGYPIAKVATKLALGYTLDEIQNDVTRVTPASFEPTLDYVVTKIPRFAFEKFLSADDTLNAQMKSVGEVMAIGRNFRESLQKGIRGLEIGRWGLGADGRGMEPDVMKAIRSGRTSAAFRRLYKILLYKVSSPNCDRLFAIKYALMMGARPEHLARTSGIDPWFIDNIRRMVKFESGLRAGRRRAFSPELFRTAKSWGYADAQIAFLTGRTPASVRAERKRHRVLPAYSLVDTCAAEFRSVTPYYYSTYEGVPARPEGHGRRTVVILGGGPNRIGQGIEFDYCCVRAVLTLKRMGYRAVLVNCNPETVSTDPYVSDRLYFEPLTSEDVLNIVDRERPLGVIIQLGGQTPLNLSHDLARAGVRILGTAQEDIDRAEDRQKFDAVLHAAGLIRPENASVKTIEEGRRVARRMGFPLLVRPSYVLGGRAMEIVLDAEGLDGALAEALKTSEGRPILIDRYLRDAIEIDVDAVSDGRDCAVVGIEEHVEEAGVHSGDSASFYPPLTLTREHLRNIQRATVTLARKLRVRGLLNVQFALQNGSLYVLEVNPRASRTVPFVSKASGIPLIDIATRVIMGERLGKLLDPRRLYFPARCCVKEAVLPFLKFSNTDIGLGPEMRSTGEVMGISRDPGLAFAKSQESSGFPLPTRGLVLISVKDPDKEAFVPIARDLVRLGFRLAATEGTGAYLAARGVPLRVLPKRMKPDGIIEWIRAGKIQMLFNTFRSTAAQSDSRLIRRAVIAASIPVMTTVAAARRAVDGIRSLQTRTLDLEALQDISRPHAVKI